MRRGRSPVAHWLPEPWRIGSRSAFRNSPDLQQTGSRPGLSLRTRGPVAPPGLVASPVPCHRSQPRWPSPGARGWRCLRRLSALPPHARALRLSTGPIPQGKGCRCRLRLSSAVPAPINSRICPAAVVAAALQTVPRRPSFPTQTEGCSRLPLRRTDATWRTVEKRSANPSSSVRVCSRSRSIQKAGK